jgi:hypothetical protein
MIAGAASLRDRAHELERNVAGRADLAVPRRGLPRAVAHSAVRQRAQYRAIGVQRRGRDAQVTVVEHLVERDFSAPAHARLQDDLLHLTRDRLAAGYRERCLVPTYLPGF